MTKADRTRHLQEADTLTPAQSLAAELVAHGKGDTEAAKAADVTRQTVNEWRHHSPAFVAAVNRTRREIWQESRERLRGLAGEAVGVLADAMHFTPPIKALPAALAVLKAVNDLPEPTGPESPEAVREAALRAKAERLVREETEAKPIGQLDKLLEEMNDDHPRRVAAMMERLRAEA